MKEDKKLIIAKYILLVLFMTYCAIYIMVGLGYYEYSNYTKKVFTEEQIKKFEEDIKNGVELDIESYLVDIKEVSYEKQIGLKISEFIGDCSRFGIKQIFKMLNKIVET